MNSASDTPVSAAPVLNSPASAGEAGPSKVSLKALCAVFLKLGFIAFGGPAAHIAMMEDEIVLRRQWLGRDEFLDLFGSANLLPGPSSTELAIFIGYRLLGLPGLLAAGLLFILPATFMVMAIAWAYVRYGRLPQVAGILYGVKPVIIAIIFQALWRLARTAVKSRLIALVGAAAVAAGFAGIPPLLVLFGAGILLSGVRCVRQRHFRGMFTLLVLASVLLFGPSVITGRARGSAHFGLTSLFLYFLKIGSVLYGSGYVLLAFLRTDLVVRWHWLTSSQLLDAIAVGQVTPGPVFTTATFIGYLLGGPRGAAVATVGIFLPAFVFVGITGPIAARLRKSPLAGGFLDGVNVAALALMIVVTLQLAHAAITDVLTAGIAVVSAAALLRFRWSSAWFLFAGACFGLLHSLELWRHF